MITLSEDNFVEAVLEASNALHKGNAIIFPTDTLYALGVNALSEKAVDHFFNLKKRPADKPVPIFVKNIEMAKTLAFIDKRQESILNKLWPGPFTFILHKKDAVNMRLSAGTQTVGLRVPADNFSVTLLEKFGGPITGSSANISGKEALHDIAGIEAQFKENSSMPDLMIDAGTLQESEPSTVIDITSSLPRIIRMNQTTLKKLKEVFDKLG